MAIVGKVGAVYVSDLETAPLPFFDETTTADAEKKRYQVADVSLRYWSPEEPVVVKVDGVVVVTGFTLEYAGGFVVFDSAQDAAEVLVSATALTLEQAGGFFNWSIDGDADDLDVTTFDVDNPQNAGWKQFAQGLKGWSGSAEAYWGDTRFFKAIGEILVLKLFIDAGPSQDCLEGFALISSEGIEASVSEVVQETIDFTGVGPLYLRF